MNANLYYNAGFVITRPIERSDWQSKENLPERFVSRSGCLAPLIPDTWCIEWCTESEALRQEEGSRFGLDAEATKQMTRKVTAVVNANDGWPSTFLDVDEALSVFNVLSELEGKAMLIQLMLSQLDVSRLRDEIAGQKLVGAKDCGELWALESGEPLARPKRSLGHELLSFDFGIEHSWLCNGLEGEAAERFNACLNAFGLIEELGIAQCVGEWINDPETGAEPGLWLPWLLVDHTPHPS